MKNDITRETAIRIIKNIESAFVVGGSLSAKSKLERCNSRNVLKCFEVNDASVFGIVGTFRVTVENTKMTVIDRIRDDTDRGWTDSVVMTITLTITKSGETM